MNIELAQRVRRHILKNHETLLMTVGVEQFFNWRVNLGKSPIPLCHTLACVAGWTCILNDDWMEFKEITKLHDAGWKHITSRAQKLLGITNEEAHELFSCTRQPLDPQVNVEKIFNRLTVEDMHKSAEIVVARLDRLIEKHVTCCGTANRSTEVN